MRSRARHPALAFTPPCLASLVATAPAGDDWFHEIKFDGYRVQAIIEAGSARILTRSGLDWTRHFQGIARECSQLPITSTVIDGEAVVLDERGVSRFSLLQRELGPGRGSGIVMMAFDLLYLDGENTSRLPLDRRKALLANVLGRSGNGDVRYVDHVEGHGPEVFSRACEVGLEGIISKRADREYRSGRHSDWTKTKCVRSDPFVVLGYTFQKGTTSLVGALAVGFYEGEALVYAGRVGTGFSLDEARAMSEAFAMIGTTAPVLARRLTRGQRAATRWVEPKLVVQVAWRDSTSDGLLRHASFERFRLDIMAGSICRPAGFAVASDPR